MKLIYVFFIFLMIGCNKQMDKNQKLINSLTNQKIEIRGNLIEINETEFRLDYYDISEEDSHYKFLESKGYQGGGPTWLAIIRGTIKMSDPNLLNGIMFDDEADGLAIWSNDRSKLEKIGRLISVVKSDNEILMQAIQVAYQNGEME